MTYRALAAAAAALVLNAGMLVAHPALAAEEAPHISGRCPAVVSQGLAGLSEAYFAGKDRRVLEAALRAERTARECGDERDAVSFELIAADAYDDVHDPKGRCAALRDAARRTMRFPDAVSVKRAARILREANACRA